MPGATEDLSRFTMMAEISSVACPPYKRIFLAAAHKSNAAFRASFVPLIMEAAFATLITSQIPSLARINLEPSGAVSKANSGSPLRADAAMLSPRLRVTMVETFVTSLYNAKGPFCPVVAETRFATSVRRVPGRPASASFSCSAITRAFSRGRSRRWSSVSARALLPPGSTTAARESPTHPHAMLHSAPPFTLETSTTVAVLPTRWP
mmetsp:Transcript_24545/g.48992  ORF Transcript_24545/g.48992 Transcript_24545/m.48992 type:complete len:207 (-) Transcript_24545:600-1220(-)